MLGRSRRRGERERGGGAEREREKERERGSSCKHIMHFLCRSLFGFAATYRQLQRHLSEWKKRPQLQNAAGRSVSRMDIHFPSEAEKITNRVIGVSVKVHMKIPSVRRTFGRTSNFVHPGHFVTVQLVDTFMANFRNETNERTHGSER